LCCCWPGWVALRCTRDRELLGIAGAAAAIGFNRGGAVVSYPVYSRAHCSSSFRSSCCSPSRERCPPPRGRVAVAACWRSRSRRVVLFQQNRLRNKQYAMPIQEIAAHIRQISTAANSAVLVDSTNSTLPPWSTPWDPRAHFCRAAIQPRRRGCAPAGRATDSDHSGSCAAPTTFSAPSSIAVRGAASRRDPVTVHPYEAFTPLETADAPHGDARSAAWSHEFWKFRR